MPSSSPAGSSSNQPGSSAAVYTPTGQPNADALYQQIVGSFANQFGSPGSTPGYSSFPNFPTPGFSGWSQPAASTAAPAAAAPAAPPTSDSSAFPSWAPQGVDPTTGLAIGTIDPSTGQPVVAIDPTTGQPTAPVNPLGGGAGIAARGGDTSGATGGFGTGSFDFSGTPGGQAYAQAQQWAGPGSIVDPNNPYLQEAIGVGHNNFLNYRGWTGPGMVTDPSNPLLQQAIIQAQNAVSDYAPFVTAFQQTQNPQQLAAQVTNYGNYLQNTLSPADMAASATSFGAGNQILNTAFDPQQSLYNTQSANALNTQNAINAMAGIAGTPYGAGVTGQNQQLFNQNWLNQQLGRQATGIGAAMPAFGTGNTLGTAGAQAGVAGAMLPYQTLAQAGGLANQVYGTLAQLAQQPYNIQTQGTQNAQTALAQLAQFAQAPYNTQALGTQNAQTALSGLANLGNNQYVLPQQTLNDLQSYLGLGQSASQISGNLGALGLQEQQNAFSGLGSLAGLGTNMLGLNNGGLGSLLGIGGAAAALPTSAASAASIGAALPGLTDAALGGSAGFGIGSVPAAAALPLAAS